ncbi:MAG: bifunctional 3,4-dihydroxy-2-butanone-4-phosphate synthase/GTP cyclohydrolase II [Chloroflexi bacterium]|nr:bifunctional 3,4-dihydroxy-2-butanone-4-phosphate synthase/GTP cyclohydrolase II [Chloroflexota bacterium]
MSSRWPARTWRSCLPTTPEANAGADPPEIDEVTKSVESAIERYGAGRMVIIVDDEDRENEGDFAMAADYVTPEAINFMATVGRGLICVPMLGQDLERLDIPLMVNRNTASLGTAFTVSVDAADGITTGISAADRSYTVQLLANPESTPTNLARPGHIFPLRYAPGGVLVRAGQTEASIDLARMAGLREAAIICEVMNEDGTMARRPELEAISKEFDIPIVSVADIIEYRFRHEKLVERVAETRLPTPEGEFKVIAYRSLVDHDEHVALVMGDVSDGRPVLGRIHSECLTGDVFGSLRCECGQQVAMARKAIAAEGRGVLLYMRQEGRGIGLHNKLKAYQLQDEGLDTVEANERLGFPMDLRHYGVGAQILVDLGVKKFNQMTNNPKKVIGLQGYGLEIQQVPLEVVPNPENVRYLKTKRDRMGHTLTGAGLD